MRYVVFVLVSALPIAWAGGMLYFWMPWPWLGIAAMSLFWGACLFSFFRWRWRSVKWMALAYALLVGWWFAVPARADRDWLPQLAVTPSAEVVGDRVTVFNVRNAHWTGEETCIVRHYNRTYDLTRLESLDLWASYWAGDAIAHTMISFGFQNGDYLAVSVEIRREKNEEYSPIAGLFKQYELFYNLADERDVVRVRANLRGERVYRFPMNATPNEMRLLFLSVMRKVNDVHERPQWYNTITGNCTTSLVAHFNEVSGEDTPYHEMLLTGYTPAKAYDAGWIRSRGVKEEHRINEAARKANDDPQFSLRIRGR